MSSSPHSQVPAVVYIFTVLGLCAMFGVASLIVYGVQMFRMANLSDGSSSVMGNLALSDTPDLAKNYLPTNFVEQGTLRVADHPSGMGELSLEYVDVSGTTTTVPLVFDELTLCSADNGALPCVAMSVSRDVAFNGRSAIVEGVWQAERVVVRHIRTVQSGEIGQLPTAGITYVPWVSAEEAIKTCGKVHTIFGNQIERTVTLTFRDSPEIWKTFEPLTGSLSAAFDEARQQRCGLLPIINT